MAASEDREELMQRIAYLEQCLAPFARLGGPAGFQSFRPDAATAVFTLAGAVTVGDFRRAAAALRRDNAVESTH
jgi:hypothetical protein